MVVEHHGAEMTPSEMANFLEDRGVGTLAFGNEDGAYAIPISFGYDRENDVCVLQFVSADTGRKAAYLRENRPVALTVFEMNSTTDWRSVVLEGRLYKIDRDESPHAANVFAEHARVATLEVFTHPIEELDISWYMLYIESKSGRQAVN